MKVLLVRPPEPHISRFYSKGESLGLGYLAAVLRQNGFDVEILDCVLNDWEHETALREISKRDFTILGFHVFAIALDDAAQLTSALREQGCVAHITMGGHFPSFRAKEVLAEFPQFDSVITFEGEETLLELAIAIRDSKHWHAITGIVYRDGEQITVNPTRPPVVNLDSLPFPARDTLPVALTWGRDAFLCTSRGCWGNCTYCSISPFGRTAGAPPWRARSPENVVDEIEHLVKTFAISTIGVVDSDFVGPGREGRKRAEAIADEIIRRGLQVRLVIYTRVDEIEEDFLRKLKAAGFTTIYLGIESGAQSALDRWRKHTTVEQNLRAIDVCQKLGLTVEAGFILYDPYTTLEEIVENLDFLERTEVYDFPVLLAKMEVRAGMAMEDQLRQEGRLGTDYRDCVYQMIDARAELFHSEICRVLEPLAEVYLEYRDLKHSEFIPPEIVQLVRRRINRRALWLAKSLIALTMDVPARDSDATFDRIEPLRLHACQEAHYLQSITRFFEQRYTATEGACVNCG